VCQRAERQHVLTTLLTARWWTGTYKEAAGSAACTQSPTPPPSAFNCAQYPAPFLEFAFETTATLVIAEEWGGFAELQFYDCNDTQLVPSAWSNPGGNQGDIASHAPDLAFDGNLGTKWLDKNKQPLIATFSTAVRVASYKWITAEGDPFSGRNPASWKLKARPLSSDAWQVLSTVVQHSFTHVNNELVGPFSLTL
jgi:hypothetical protein